MKKTPKNMQALAKELGLSRATVSYVLNDKWRKHNISEGTVKKVKDYVEETGFTPNIFSLALKNELSYDLAILMPPTDLEHHKRAFFTMISWIQESGMTYIILPFTGNKYETTMLQLKLYKVRNIIIFANSLLGGSSLWEKMFHNLPQSRWIFYDFPFEKSKDKCFLRKNVFCVGIDRNKAEESIYKYIAKKNYKQVILQKNILGKEDIVAHIEKLNLLACEKLTYTSNAESELLKRGEQIGRQISKLDFSNKKTAVYINDDFIAAGAISTLQRADIEIPEDLGLISWDGLPESKYFNMALTTLEIPHKEMLEITRNWIESKEKSDIVKLKTTIRPGATL